MGVALVLLRRRATACPPALQAPSVARSYGPLRLSTTSVGPPGLTTLGYASVLAELGSPGSSPASGRPPSGAWPDRSATRASDRVHAGSGPGRVDTTDWESEPRQVVTYVESSANSGSTVPCMHMQHAASIPTRWRRHGRRRLSAREPRRLPHRAHRPDAGTRNLLTC